MKNLNDERKSKRLVRFGWFELPKDNSIVRFCEDSGLHGIKYITGPKQHFCERLFWLVAIIMATVTGSYLIHGIWQQYYNLPVVFVQSQKRLSIEEFPFPSVTVCGVNRVKRETYEKYYTLSIQADEQTNTTVQEAKEVVKILNDVCHPGNILLKSMLWKDNNIFGVGIQSTFLTLELSQNFQNESKIMKLLNENSQSCDDLIPTISFQTSYRQAYFLVEKVETDFGICCTFNTIPILKLKPWRNISIEDMDYKGKRFYKDNPWLNETVSADTLIFTEKTKDRPHPRRQHRSGIPYGLSLTLKTNTNKSHCNSSDLNGFLVSISNPLDAPSTKNRENFVEFKTEVFFTLKPKLTLADDSIKRFTPEKRGCYFDNELKLSGYSVYTQHNCWQECIANSTMGYCQELADCWSAISIHMGINSDWMYGHFCETRELCSREANKKLNLWDGETTCKHCLPTCTDIKYEYNVEVKHIQDDYIKKLEERPWASESVNGNKSFVHVYFDEYYTTPVIRKEQFGIFELLASSGGLLGLCLGFSGISILEIIYYFTIRVGFRHFRRKVILKNNEIPPDNISNHKDVAENGSFQFVNQAETETSVGPLQNNVS